MMFCKKCGQQLPDGTKFCTKCGAPTIVMETQPQNSVQQPTINQPVVNQPYQTATVSRKKFPGWATALIVIGAIAVGIAVIGIVATISSNQTISSAKEFLQNGDYDAAKQLFEEELEYHGEDFNLHILLADCYLGQEDYKGALSVLEKAKEDVDDVQPIEQKINEIKQTYASQIEAERKAEEEAKRKAEEEARKKAEEEKKQEEKEKQDYVKSCQAVSYKDLLRNPDNYKGKKIKITVEIQQIMTGGVFTEGGYRAYEDYDIGVGDTFLQKEWYVKGLASESGTKILTDDVVIFYGEYTGTVEVKRALTGVKEEVPCLDFEYYSIIQG